MSTISKLLQSNLLWIIFAAFTVMGVMTMKDESILISHGPYGAGKYIIWFIFVGFFGYTYYASLKENFFKSVKRMSEMYWGWQVGIDLYIGLLLPMLIIFMHGGTLIFLLWLVPILINANLFTLLYFALNYDSLVGYFFG